MSAPYLPYAGAAPLSVEDRAAQIRHLSTIGLAATNSAWNITDPNSCFVSLFEVIARLANEIEEELDQ